MSIEEFKRIDRVIQWGLKAVMALGIGACSLIFKTMWSDISINTETTNSVSTKLEKLEQKLEDHIKYEEEATKRIQSSLDKLNK